MKIRSGFVSNSSSSSFMCDLCGDLESGMDACLDDFGMSECENGHTVCNSHRSAKKIKEEPPIEEKINKIIEIWGLEGEEADEVREASETSIDAQYEEALEETCDEEDDTYSFPAALCPICQLTGLDDATMVKVLLHFIGSTREEYLAMLKKQYGTLDKLMEVVE